MAKRLQGNGDSKGKIHFETVAPGHVDAVRSAVFDPLTDEQTTALGEALEIVLERLDPDRSLRVEHGDAVHDEA